MTDVEEIMNYVARRSYGAGNAMAESKMSGDSREVALARMLNEIYSELEHTQRRWLSRAQPGWRTGSEEPDAEPEPTSVSGGTYTINFAAAANAAESIKPTDTERYSALVREAEIAARCGHIDTVNACLKVADFIKLNGS